MRYALAQFRVQLLAAFRHLHCLCISVRGNKKYTSQEVHGALAVVFLLNTTFWFTTNRRLANIISDALFLRPD